MDDWRTLAACLDHPTLTPDVFVPSVDPDVVPDAVAALCASCPVAVECRVAALTSASIGLWGGMTTAERRAWWTATCGPAARLPRRCEWCSMVFQIQLPGFPNRNIRYCTAECRGDADRYRRRMRARVRRYEARMLRAVS